MRPGSPNTALLPYKTGSTLQRLLAVRGMGRDPRRWVTVWVRQFIQTVQRTASVLGTSVGLWTASALYLPILLPLSSADGSA